MCKYSEHCKNAIMEIHIFSNESKCSVCVLCGIEQYNKRIMEFPNIQLHPIALTYRPAIHTSDVWPRKPSIRIRCREEIPQLDTPYSSIHVALPAPHRLRSAYHTLQPYYFQCIYCWPDFCRFMCATRASQTLGEKREHKRSN